MEQDFLDEMIEESTRRNPKFSSLMEDTRQGRVLLSRFAEIRRMMRIRNKWWRSR